MEDRKLYNIKTQPDVKIDDDYDSYALDLSSGVNKGYLKLNCLTKDASGNDFDANQAVINNTALYYDGLYQKTTLTSREYVDLMDNNLETKIDGKIQNKADLSTNNEQTFNSIINVPNFDQGYSNMSNVMNKEYIDSRDALNKTYADNTYLTKKSGGVLAQSLQNKADKSYVDNTFLKKVIGRVLTQKILSKLDIHGSDMMQANLDMNDNRITNLSKPIYGTDGVNKLYVDSSHITSIDKGNVFNNIMIDSDNQLSEENDIELGDLIHHPNPVHQINKKVIDTKLLLDSSKNYYSSRLGINMYPIPINYYTMAFELYFPVEIDENSVDISVVSLIDTVNKVTTRVYNGYSRTIAQVHKYQQHNNNYLYVDIVLKMKSGHSYVPKLQTYIIIYGIKNYESNVEPSIYDQIYYVENDRIAFNASIDMKTQAIHGIAEGTTDDQAVNYKQLKNFRDDLKSDLELKMDKKRNISYYHKIFEYFYDLTDPSEFIMADSNGAVVSGLNGNLVFNPTKLLEDFDPKNGFMSGFEINLNENVTESDEWTIYMAFKYDYKAGDNKRFKINFDNGSSFDFPWVKVESNQLSLDYDLDISSEQIRAGYIANQPRVYKPRPPIPTPRKSVKQRVQDYEENIIQPPIPKPRTIKQVKPTPATRTKIEETDKALKGYTKSYQITIRNNKDPLLQLQNTRKAVEYHINKILSSLKGIKFVETLKITFSKMSGDSLIYKTAYFNSKAQTIINNLEIAESLQESKQKILNFVALWISEGSGWTIQSVDSHHLNVVKYEPIKGSSYIILPQELRNSSKGLINIKNKDNECFRWCHIRHLNKQDKYPQRIKKSDKAYIERLDYSEIEFPVTIKQINKIEKKNSIRINVFGYENKQPYPIYISKETFEDHMELLLITNETKQHYVLIKDFNKFMYNQTKHKERKHFCMHCLQCFSSNRILNNHKNNCIQVNGTQAIKMPTKDNNILKFENFHKQQEVPFVIYADFEAITEKVSGCNPYDDKSYTEAYQKHRDCGYGYKVVCCYDDKYSKPVQIYRGEKAVYKFMEKMLEEVYYCKKVMRKHFNKPLKMTKDDEDAFQKANGCHICDKAYTDDDIRVRDHCHITGKFRGSAHQECNLKLRIEPDKIKIPVIFHNLKGYDSHFIMQEIGAIVKDHTYKNKKGEIKEMNINTIPNNMETYMAFMLEKGMRGGISYIANRYGKANNKYMKEYDEKAPSKYIMYLDANNLYGWAMSQYLPSGKFKWLTEKQTDETNLAKYENDSKKGLILEVDSEYSEILHNTHNDYPCAPEKVKVTKDMLSNYCKSIAEKYNISTGLVHKLIPTLKNREKYVLHYRNLQLYLDLGLKLTKVHRVLEFNQSPWLKEYIDFNTLKRTNAKNAFEKDFFKLMNNSVFGKTMENLRKRVDVRLVTNEKKLLKMTSKPTYVSSKIFNEDLVAVHKIKETLTLNKPAYVGMCILDLSKTLMYDFHYNYIKKKYGKRAKLLFTDTDSLTYEIQAEDVYKDFFNDKEKFDNCDYPESSQFYNKTNKKVIGKFKDEAAGVPICEFIGLRSKMYSYIKDNNKQERTAKGIKKYVIKKDMTHENYKDTLFNNKQMHHTMKTIRSQNHQLGSYEINKVSLSCFDDKRYILDDGKTSYAYGHYNIKQKL
ncbi:hypothetical protein ACROYT_G026122 [Oculina patagonica]